MKLFSEICKLLSLHLNEVSISSRLYLLAHEKSIPKEMIKKKCSKKMEMFHNYSTKISFFQFRFLRKIVTLRNFLLTIQLTKNEIFYRYCQFSSN